MSARGSTSSGSRLRAVTPDSHWARLKDTSALAYCKLPPADADVAPHVRAASGVRRVGGELWIVQDDVNALAIHGAGNVRSILLPAGPNGERSFSKARGNKRLKLDLEASIALPDGRLLAFGSGSTSARERIVISTREGGVSVRDAGELYRSMRERREFSGSELNIEGAVVVGDVLRFFQRGNGAVVDECKPINATCDLPLTAVLAWLDTGAPLPDLQRITSYELGSVEGVPWTFTDATVVGDEVVFVGAAEASPDTYRDGEVVGSCIGLLEAGAARVFPVVDLAGELVRIKLEGIEYRPDTTWSFDVVADMDDPDVPALLGTVELTPR